MITGANDGQGARDSIINVDIFHLCYNIHPTKGGGGGGGLGLGGGDGGGGGLGGGGSGSSPVRRKRKLSAPREARSCE